MKTTSSPDGIISLSFSSSTNDDTAVYKCTISNEAGSVNSQAKVTVSGIAT